MVKTLVLGLGNPILSDDSVGLRVARALEGRLNQEQVTTMEASLAGLNLLELLLDFDKVIIIDAIQTKGGKVGQIYRLAPESFDTTRRSTASHDINFTTALELGKKLGLALPQQIVTFAIEVKEVSSFSEKCSSQLEDAIPTCAEMVIEEIASDNL